MNFRHDFPLPRPDLWTVDVPPDTDHTGATWCQHETRHTLTEICSADVHSQLSRDMYCIALMHHFRYLSNLCHRLSLIVF